jgi:hypothetical protein
MQNTEELKKAIKAFSEYSPSQCAVLELFIDIAVDNVIHASVKYISDKAKIKTSTTYFSINLFLKDGIIRRDQGTSKAFVLVEEKLNYILDAYYKKCNIEK